VGLQQSMSPSFFPFPRFPELPFTTKSGAGSHIGATLLLGTCGNCIIRLMLKLLLDQAWLFLFTTKEEHVSSNRRVCVCVCVCVRERERERERERGCYVIYALGLR
jgi:hypothetical protein